jgi:hypothetical protein
VVNELDLLNGETIVPVEHGSVLVDESNYAQLSGLHGGRNTITVLVESFAPDPAVRSVRVLPGSGVYSTPLGPSDLSIALPSTVRVAEGADVKTTVTLRNAGDAARRTILRIGGSNSTFAVVGKRAFSVGTVPTAAARRVAVTVHGSRAGRGTLEAVAKSAGGEPEASSEVVVFRYRNSAGATSLAIGLIALATLGAVGVLLRWRRPASQGPPRSN